jgi:phosphoribosylamine--glycine ligase
VKVGKFLILSESGSGAGLALRLKAEGHEAKMKVFDSDYDGLGEGIVDCACNYSFGETVVADCVGFGHVLESYREAGVRIFGGGVFADHLETDRLLAEEVFKQAGVETPKASRAQSWDDAAKMVEDIGSRSEKVVLKPEGGLSGVVPSYVARDVEEALEVLRRFQAKAGTSEVNLTIQEYIEGVALSTEGWFNGEDWAPGMFNHTIERKQFLVGDLGPSTGCTGNVVWACDSGDPVVKEVLTKLTLVLRKHRYVGAIDVNTIVNEEGVYALEFTPRFGYDAFPTLLYSLCDFDFGAFIDDLAAGRDTSVTLSPGFGAGIRIGVPPWPSEQFHGEAGIKIRGFAEEDKQWFYPYEVCLVDDELQSSKGFGILGVVNGQGGCVGEAFARAYRIVSKLRIADLQYRLDLGEACLRDYRELRKTLGEDEAEGWIGVDLDGTLARYEGWSEDIGEPIGPMVQRVRRWLREGKDVRILTARGAVKEGRFEQLCKIYDWTTEHIGEPLEVTASKDPEMIRLYDDRVVRVDANEGTLVR